MDFANMICYDVLPDNEAWTYVQVARVSGPQSPVFLRVPIDLGMRMLTILQKSSDGD